MCSSIKMDDKLKDDELNSNQIQSTPLLTVVVESTVDGDKEKTVITENSINSTLPNTTTTEENANSMDVQDIEISTNIVNTSPSQVSPQNPARVSVIMNPLAQATFQETAAQNSSLNLLSGYGSESDGEAEDKAAPESSSEEESDSSSSSSDSSSSDEDSSSSDDDSSSSGHYEDPMEIERNAAPKKSGPLKVKGEMLIDDLPPIEDLTITVPETECLQIGKVFSMVDQLGRC